MPATNIAPDRGHGPLLQEQMPPVGTMPRRVAGMARSYKSGWLLSD